MVAPTSSTIAPMAATEVVVTSLTSAAQRCRHAPRGQSH